MNYDRVTDCALIIPKLVRYGLVGIATNAIGYGVYLLVTFLGVAPKVAMTLLYVVGTTLAYLGNARFTFRHQGAHGGSAFRFALVYACGYGLNFGLLAFFVDRLHYPHQLVQGCAIFVTAGFLFIALNIFVFPSDMARPVAKTAID